MKTHDERADVTCERLLFALFAAGKIRLLNNGESSLARVVLVAVEPFHVGERGIVIAGPPSTTASMHVAKESPAAGPGAAVSPDAGYISAVEVSFPFWKNYNTPN